MCSFINSAIHPFLILVMIPPPTIHSYMPYVPQLILRSKVSEKEERDSHVPRSITKWSVCRHYKPILEVDILRVEGQERHH